MVAPKVVRVQFERIKAQLTASEEAMNKSHRRIKELERRVETVQGRLQQAQERSNDLTSEKMELQAKVIRLEQILDSQWRRKEWREHQSGPALPGDNGSKMWHFQVEQGRGRAHGPLDTGNDRIVAVESGVAMNPGVSGDNRDSDWNDGATAEVAKDAPCDMVPHPAITKLDLSNLPPDKAALIQKALKSSTEYGDIFQEPIAVFGSQAKTSSTTSPSQPISTPFDLESSPRDVTERLEADTTSWQRQDP